MELSEILNYILGGGVLALLVGVMTMKATVREANAKAEQAKAEAEKAKAEAESVRIDNAEHATRILIENIVEPLKKELNETRKDLQATKREMARLRKAINDAKSCRLHDDCPVLDGLRRSEATANGGDAHIARESDKCEERARSPNE